MHSRMVMMVKVYMALRKMVFSKCSGTMHLVTLKAFSRELASHVYSEWTWREDTNMNFLLIRETLNETVNLQNLQNRLNLRLKLPHIPSSSVWFTEMKTEGFHFSYKPFLTFKCARFSILINLRGEEDSLQWSQYELYYYFIRPNKLKQRSGSFPVLNYLSSTS